MREYSLLISLMRVHVLLFNSGENEEGIHSLELAGKTVVLMFENPDDAFRYGGLLEAQDFPLPKVEELDRQEVETFCEEAGYEARLVEAGFLPTNEEDRLLISPPETNLDITNWDQDGSQTERSQVDDVDEIRRRLEGLL